MKKLLMSTVAGAILATSVSAISMQDTKNMKVAEGFKKCISEKGNSFLYCTKKFQSILDKETRSTEDEYDDFFNKNDGESLGDF